MKNSVKSILLALHLICSLGFSQVFEEKKVTIEELFDLVKKNHPTLAVAKANIAVASKAVEQAKTSRLPSLDASINAMYIGDANLLSPDFSQNIRLEMPHFGNNFSIEAKQLLWKGNLVNNSIKAKTLQEELASLEYDSNEQNIKLLVLGYYLDLYKLQNQSQVYKINIALAEKRLENIRLFYKQGMITRNDIIRGELQLSNLQLALQVVENDSEILNRQLLVSLGFSDEVKISPDERIFQEIMLVEHLDNFQEEANIQHPTILLTQKALDIYEVSGKIIKAQKFPTLVAFAGNSLQRPIMKTTPVTNMYSNGWQVGVALSYDISSLYKTNKSLEGNRLEVKKAQLRATEVKQMINTAIKAAYIKYNEAQSRVQVLENNQRLANENYKIMESKYMNQLAILLDIIDASNAKLDAELQHENAKISVIFSYYKLLKESGKI